MKDSSECLKQRKRRRYAEVGAGRGIELDARYALQKKGKSPGSFFRKAKCQGKEIKLDVLLNILYHAVDVMLSPCNYTAATSLHFC